MIEVATSGRDTELAAGANPMRLTCYRIVDSPPAIVPGRADRDWMDASDQRFAYRCLPLTIANAIGWEILLASGVAAEWNGGDGLDDIAVETETGAPEHMVASHFGHGVLTFQTGYLFRTDPGIGLWVRGAPNRPKDGIAPLDGVVETDWLDFSFTMNWKFTRPGRVVFEKDEPFCFISPVAYRSLLGVTPEIRSIGDDPRQEERFRAYAEARRSFNQRLIDEDPETVRAAWQKWYTRGETPAGEKPNPGHLSKLRLETPESRPRQDVPSSSGQQDIHQP